MKKIILNADDFGMTPLFSQAILDLMKDWCLTSTSVMVSRLSYSDKLQVEELITLRVTRNISIWLHIEFFDTNFEYHIERQLDWFKNIFGFLPDHFDLHAKTYLNDWYSYIVDTALKHDRPCRSYDIAKTKWAICVSNKESLTRQSIEEIISRLHDTHQWSIELILHPGYEDLWYVTWLKKERQDDIEKIREIVLYIQDQPSYSLISYREL